MNLASKPLTVIELAEGGYLVRGTLDIEAARAALIDYLRAAPDDWGQMRTLATAECIVENRHPGAGWYRCNPCACGGEHTWDLGSGWPGQRGSFRAVEWSLW